MADEFLDFDHVSSSRAPTAPPVSPAPTAPSSATPALAPTPQPAGKYDDLIVVGTPTSPETLQETPKETLSHVMGNYWNQSFGALGPEYKAAVQDSLKGMHDGLNQIFQAETIGGRAWGALELAGGAIGYVASPFEALGLRFGDVVGKPAEEATGIKGLESASRRFFGTSASIVGTLAADPIVAAGKAVQAVRALKPVKGVTEAISPATATEEAQTFHDIIRAHNGMLAQADAIASHELKVYQGKVNRLPEAQRFQFIDDIEELRPQTLPDLDPAASKLGERLDKSARRVETLGPGAINRAIEGYFPHYWANPTGEIEEGLRAIEAERAAQATKSPIRGTAAFKKKRTISTTKEGMDKGLIPLSSDPIEMVLWKTHELDKFYFGTKLGQAIKDSGIPKFVPYNDRAPVGWKPLNDRYFRAVLPPFHINIPAVRKMVDVLHETSYDPAIARGLEDVAGKMGVPIKQPLRSEDPYLAANLNTQGYTTGTVGDPIVSVFGNAQTVLEHELGHQIDFKYGISREIFQKNPQAWEELGQLALLRRDPVRADTYRQRPDYIDYLRGYEQFQQGVTGDMRYLLNAEERIANFFHAYWYAPQLLRELAPNAAKAMDDLVFSYRANDPIVQAIKAIKPSLRHEAATRVETKIFETPEHDIHAPGLRMMGEWYAPPEAARVFNNYVEPSRLGTGVMQSPYNAVRQAANALNQVQLGVSGYHLFFTTVDTMISKLGQGLKDLSHGEFGRAAVNIGTSFSPTTAFLTGQKGHRLRAAYLNPGNATPELQKLVHALTQAGGRINMDQFYQLTKGNGLFGSIRDGSLMRGIQDEFKYSPYKTVLKTPFKLAGKLLQSASYPIMEFIVPRQKLGVFYDMASDFMRRNPNASAAEFRRGVGKLWNHVDDRLGQMVYDNVFWSKTAKDIAFIAVRSVGWNMGTIRALVGGGMDAARAVHALGTGKEVEFTERMGYAIAMPILTAYLGAIASYLYTGKGPQEIKDYFFPKTGRKTPKGDDERVSIPSYIKDVLEWNSHPWQTLNNKLNPIWGTWGQIIDNKDFYGAEIRNTEDPAFKQMQDFAKYMAQTFEPFSVRGAIRVYEEGGGVGQVAGAFGGLQPAPGFITAPERYETFHRREVLRARRKKARMEAEREQKRQEREREQKKSDKTPQNTILFDSYGNQTR
jgi:hypothetical protein